MKRKSASYKTKQLTTETLESRKRSIESAQAQHERKKFCKQNYSGIDLAQINLSNFDVKIKGKDSNSRISKHSAYGR